MTLTAGTIGVPAPFTPTRRGELLVMNTQLAEGLNQLGARYVSVMTNVPDLAVTAVRRRQGLPWHATLRAQNRLGELIQAVDGGLNHTIYQLEQINEAIKALDLPDGGGW